MAGRDLLWALSGDSAEPAVGTLDPLPPPTGRGRDLLWALSNTDPIERSDPLEQEPDLPNPIAEYFRSAWSGLTGQNAQALGGAMEGATVLAGGDAGASSGRRLRERAIDWDISTPLTWEQAVEGGFLSDLKGISAKLGQLAGIGTGSLAGVGAGAAAGAAVGSVVPGIGTTIGAGVGAMSAGMMLAFGGTYNQLVGEGVNEKLAAKVAAGAAPVIGALDAIGGGKVLTSTVAADVKRRAISNIAAQAARGYFQGAKAEGITELIQGAVQESIAAVTTGNPDLGRRAVSAIEEGLAGALGGGAVSGTVSGAREALRPDLNTGSPMDELVQRGARVVDDQQSGRRKALDDDSFINRMTELGGTEEQVSAALEAAGAKTLRDVPTDQRGQFITKLRQQIQKDEADATKRAETEQQQSDEDLVFQEEVADLRETLPTGTSFQQLEAEVRQTMGLDADSAVPPARRKTYMAGLKRRVRRAQAAAKAAEKPAGGTTSTTASGDEQIGRTEHGTAETPTEPIAGPAGSETTLRLPKGVSQLARYRVVEASTLIPSHHPVRFSMDPRYPAGVQERTYHTDPNAQADVERNARELEPDQIVNTDPTAIGGPPQVTPTGIVLGGNGRTMSIQRAYQDGGAEGYRTYLAEHAGSFGIDSAEVEGMDQPVLVRELVNAPGDTEGLRRLGHEMNADFKKSLSEVEQAVSTGKNLSENTTELIAAEVEARGGDVSLRKLMDDNPRMFRDRLLADGVLTENQLNQYFTSTGTLNAAGKDFVENALVGSFIRDADLLESLPRGLVKKLERAVPPMMELSSREDAWNISTDVQAASRLVAEAQVKGMPVSDLVRQRGMFEESASPEVEALAAVLARKESDVGKAFKAYASEARMDVPGQKAMFGKPDPMESFRRIFGGEQPLAMPGATETPVEPPEPAGGILPTGEGGTAQPAPSPAAPAGESEPDGGDTGRTLFHVTRGPWDKGPVRPGDVDEFVTNWPDVSAEHVSAHAERVHAWDTLEEALEYKRLHAPEGEVLELRRQDIDDWLWDDLDDSGHWSRSEAVDADEVFPHKSLPAPAPAPTPPAADPDEQARLIAEMDAEVDAAFGDREEDLFGEEYAHSAGGRPTLPSIEEAERKEMPTELVRKSDIMRELSEKLRDIPIRVGRLSQRRALGIYKVLPESIRLRRANDIPVAAHEIGHHINKIMYGGAKGKLNWRPFKAYRSELEPIATEPARKGQSKLPEGFAEFIRLYITRPAEALEKAPKFHAHFEAQLDAYPELRDVLQHTQEQVRRYVEQPAAAKVLSHISTDDAPRPSNRWSRIYTHLKDKLRPVQELVRATEAGDQAAAEQNAYKLARVAAGAVVKGERYLNDGTFDFEGVDVNGKGLKQILEPLHKEGQLDNLRIFLVAQHSLELTARGKETGITADEARAAIEQTDSPLIRQAADDVYAFQDRVLRYLVDGGMLSEDGYKALRKAYPRYVPFNRVMDDSGGAKQGGGKGFGDLWSPIKRLKGSGRDIIDPIESIAKHVYNVMSLTERNAAMAVAANVADTTEGIGNWIERVPPKMESTTFKLYEVKAEISAALEDAGISLEGLDPSDLEVMARIFRPQIKGSPQENVITVWRDGERQLYQVEKNLYESLMASDEETANMVVKVAAVPARALRFGATAVSPEFIFRNPMRDFLVANIQSQDGFINTLRGVFSVLRKDDWWQDWMRSGGALSSMQALDRKNIKQNIDDMLSGNMKWALHHPLDAMRIVSDAFEQATRVEVFRAARRSGHSKREAAFRSRENPMDYARIGASARSLNMIIAFFNAGLEGTDKFVRVHRENPKAIAKAAAMVTLPTMILYALNHDDEDYNELPRWQRDFFWMIPTKGTPLYEHTRFIPIPKPFLWGTVYGTVPERAMEWIKERDQKALDGVFGALWNNSMPALIPTSIMMPLEWWANKSMFTGRPIVPQSLERLPGRHQHQPWTSEFAKQIADGAHRLGIDVSPMKVDNAINNISAGFGRALTTAMNPALRDPNAPPPSSATPADIPGLRAFAVRFPTGSAESIQKIYDRYEELDQMKAEEDLLREQLRLRPDRAAARQEFREGRMSKEQRKELNTLSAYRRRLQVISRRMRNVMASYDLTPDEKRARINELNEERLEVAQEGLSKSAGT